jgi:hypothetical protein
MKGRVMIAAVGVAGATYGAWLLLGAGLADLVQIAIWLAAGVVLHDFVLVPLTLAAGWAGTRVLPSRVRAPVVVGVVLLGSLTLLAVPVLGGWGANSDNATILDRDYPAGWLVVVGLTAAGVVVGMLTQSWGRRSRGPGARRR